MENRIINEKIFSEILEKKLTEEQYKRALKMLKVYGPFLSWDVTNVVLKSTEENKTEKILRVLELHNKHKKGFFGNSSEANNDTRKMFTRIMEKILGFVPY